MNIKDITEETLNLFIDEQLDTNEMNEIRKILLDDKSLRERVCQLKAVRELIAYAYTEVPGSGRDKQTKKQKKSFIGRAIAASITLTTGVVLGWTTYQYSPNAISAVSAENTFQYVANHVSGDHAQRKIVLHIDSGDLKVVNAALSEVETLLASYRKANVPMQLEVVTNKEGINVLRPGVSPYIGRIQRLMDDEGVVFYACEQSLNKAFNKEGVDIVLMPEVKTKMVAREIIPDRLKKGWVYIKA